MSETYRICTRCVMDTTDPDIEFDENGECNHCRNYNKIVNNHVYTGQEGERKLSEIVDEIKKRGRGQKYDCIIGLSGGVDSTYVAYITKKLGLRPLAITLDNGWDSEIAKNNVKNIVDKLDLDLYTYVINWNEVKDLQLAYLEASVVNIEAITDHAIRATLYNTAHDRGINYILGGTNIVTEGIMPNNWRYNTNDLVNLVSIHNQYGKVKLESFPTLGLRKLLYYQQIKDIKYISILNYTHYVKDDVKRLIARELDWKDYGAKHFESIFTRFYQAYILPRKFNIDKRKAHLSALICSGQITREEALDELRKDPYTEEGLKEDKEYVLSKLGLTNGDFDELMNIPIKSNLDYKTDIEWKFFSILIFRGIGSILRVFRYL